MQASKEACMARSRARSFFTLILLVFSFAFIEIACGSTPPEQQLLTNFFRAARVRDNTTLGNIAAVNFNPRTEGTVEDFEIVSVSAEQRRPVEIRALLDEEAKAKEEEAEFSRRSAEFQATNKDAISRVAKAESARQPVRGADAEVLASLAKWRTEQAQYSKRLSDARTRLTRERSQVVGSLTPPGQPDVDVSNMQAELVSKEVTVNAQVRTPEGQTVPRTIVFTFQRAVAKDADRTREGRWLITGLQQQGAPPPTS
jgi:hypothetical protein